MPLIFCELQLGDADQTIFLLSENGMTVMATASLNELSEVIRGVSIANNVDKVLLRGVHDYAIKVADELINKGLTVEIK